MRIFLGYLYTLVALIVLDGIWLGVIAKPFYQKWLGYLMAPTPNWIAVILFYLLYASAILFFVITPAIQDHKNLFSVFFIGAFFGLVAYGTYDLTSHAITKDWPVIVTVYDMVWGMIATGTVSTVITWLLRR